MRPPELRRTGIHPRQRGVHHGRRAGIDRYHALIGRCLADGHGASTTGSSRGLFGFFLVEVLGRQENGPVQCVWETTVATTDHHGDDDEFGENGEFGAEAGVDVRVAQ